MLLFFQSCNTEPYPHFNYFLKPSAPRYLNMHVGIKDKSIALSATALIKQYYQGRWIKSFLDKLLTRLHNKRPSCYLIFTYTGMNYMAIPIDSFYNIDNLLCIQRCFRQLSAIHFKSIFMGHLCGATNKNATVPSSETLHKFLTFIENMEKCGTHLRLETDNFYGDHTLMPYIPSILIRKDTNEVQQWRVRSNSIGFFISKESEPQVASVSTFILSAGNYCGRLKVAIPKLSLFSNNSVEWLIQTVCTSNKSDNLVADIELVGCLQQLPDFGGNAVLRDKLQLNNLRHPTFLYTYEAQHKNDESTKWIVTFRCAGRQKITEFRLTRM
ncbi:hypothetical protein Ddc_13584 [Ditylenchus destructor]|nr:hypothetical protein Ddc_13584 [Ditylenchus destructor]